MAFEGALLSTHIIQAILNIPACIKNIKEILSKKEESDTSTALEKLDELRNHLIMFDLAASWLEEIKRLHEHLQRFDETLEPIRRQYQNALESGKFISQNYRLSEVRKTWEIAKSLNLNSLIAFAQQIERIEKAPLVISSNGKFISGPKWARSLLLLRANIDKCFTEYDKGNDSAVIKIAEYMNSLAAYIKNDMFYADERLRKEATKLGNSLSELSGRLKNG